MNSWVLFRTEQCRVLSAQNPGMDISKICEKYPINYCYILYIIMSFLIYVLTIILPTLLAQHLSAQWSAMSDSEKEPYVQKAEALRQQYKVDLARWEQQQARKNAAVEFEDADEVEDMEE